MSPGKLHVFTDGLGYYANEITETIYGLDPAGNVFINLLPCADEKYRNNKILTLDFNSVSFHKWLSESGPFERVYFHFYTYKGAQLLQFLKQKNPDIISYWVFWSADFYNLPHKLSQSLLPYSRAQQKIHLFKETLLKPLFHLIQRLARKPYYTRQSFFKSFEAIDFFCTLLPRDYENVKVESQAKFRYMPFVYLSLERMLGDAISGRMASGTDIMVGHSPDPMLNHYEVLQQIAAMPIENTIYLPMGYGQSPYGEKIISAARQLYPASRLRIQTSLLPKEAYYAQLQQVGFAVFNIFVQQGIGNLIGLFWMGAKIFLRKSNPIYIDFKRWGFILFSIEDDLNAPQLSAKLKEAEIVHNRERLQEIFGKTAVEEKYRQLLAIA